MSYNCKVNQLLEKLLSSIASCQDGLTRAYRIILESPLAIYLLVSVTS